MADDPGQPSTQMPWPLRIWPLAVMAEIRCAGCGQPAGDPGTDAVVVARAAVWLGVHFHLCALCAELDLRHTGHRG